MNLRRFLSDPDGISQTRPAAQSGRHAAHIFGSARLGTQVSCRRGTPRRRRPRRRALRRSPSHKSCHGRLQPLARFPNWGWRGKRRLRPVEKDACCPGVMRQSRARNRPSDPRFSVRDRSRIRQFLDGRHRFKHGQSMKYPCAVSRLHIFVDCLSAPMIAN